LSAVKEILHKIALQNHEELFQAFENLRKVL
jgi:hypothetical protein